MNQSSPPPQRSVVVPETPSPPQVSSPLLQTPINSSPPVIVDGTLPTTVIRPPVQGVVQGAMSPRVLSFRDVNSNGNGNGNGSNGSGNGGGSGRRKSALLLKRIKSKSKKSKQSKQSKRKSKRNKVQKKKTRRSRYN